MSYIRMGQDGSYVEIPGGSNYYLYDNGNDIEGWSYGEFAALIGGVLDEIDWMEGTTRTDNGIRHAFTEHFGGWDEGYRGGVTPPERGEIFCQCVDRRIDGVELTDSLHEAVQEWADDFDAMRECEYCGEELRPHLYNDETRYVCNSRECELKSEAENYGLTVEQVKEAHSFDDPRMTDKPERPSDPRGGEPYYIDDECNECGAALQQCEDAAEKGWYDEWECPNCLDGVYMDWPQSKFEELKERAQSSE